jgi:hypothetical protein
LVYKTGYEQGDSHGRKLIIPADPKKKGCTDRRALELLYAECEKCPAVLKFSRAEGTGTATSVTILEQKFKQGSRRDYRLAPTLLATTAPSAIHSDPCEKFMMWLRNFMNGCDHRF